MSIKFSSNHRAVFAASLEGAPVEQRNEADDAFVLVKSSDDLVGAIASNAQVRVQPPAIDMKKLKAELRKTYQALPEPKAATLEAWIYGEWTPDQDGWASAMLYRAMLTVNT